MPRVLLLVVVSEKVCGVRDAGHEVRSTEDMVKTRSIENVEFIIYGLSLRLRSTSRIFCLQDNKKVFSS